ncbi:MAG: aldose 1-epimerase family protein [Clostridia bacterium]|nr:aldose 1-epimerase family protein [Clostridia bacterium]
MSEYKLSYGKSTASVRLKGAQITSFRGADGREVIWQADPAVWAQHAPVLFPVCGSVRNDQIRIDGKYYPMTKHGFTRNPDFKLCHLGEDFIDLVLEADEETRKMYPFDFAFHVTYRLFENGYTTTFMVENLSEKVMPLCLGGHPGFNCPMAEGARFEDYVLEFEKAESGINQLAPMGGLINGSETLSEIKDGRYLTLDHALFDARDALIFAGLNSRSVKLVHSVTGHGIKFDFPKMEVLAVWSKPGANAPYVCLEPWHGMPAREQDGDDFEKKPYVTLLDPGRVYTSWFTVTVI